MNRTLLAAIAALVPLAASAESFTCGKWIVNNETTVGELVQKCGTPASRESKTVDVMARNRDTGLMVKTGESTTERWTYDRGTGKIPMVVIIVDGRIKSIEKLQR